MQFTATDLQDAWLITPKVFTDARGFFCETFSRKPFLEKGLVTDFVQDNHSRSIEMGVLRGLHFQRPPYSQTKLIRATVGRIWDVIVDLRKSSPTYLKWQGFELSSDNFQILYVPQGFAHGFCTLVPNTEVQYKVDNLYAPQHDGGIHYADPQFAIPWPVAHPVVSDKDSRLPMLSSIENPF